MTIALVGFHRLNFQHEADVALGFRPVGQSVKCSVASSFYDGDLLRTLLADCKASGQFAVVWLNPEPAQVPRTVADILAIADHHDVSDAIDALDEHCADGTKCLVRLFEEFLDTHPADGRLRWLDPVTYTTLYDAVAARLPAGAIPTLDLEPSGGSAFGAWVPKLWKVGGLDMYGDLSVDGKSKKWQTAALWANFVSSQGRPLVILECSSTDGDVFDADERNGYFYGRLLRFCGTFNVRALLGPANDNHAGFAKPWPAGLGWKSGRWAPGSIFLDPGQTAYPGCPGTADMLRKKLGSPEFLKLALTDPLKEVGIA